jgi:RNA polymerase sigma factor (sigma-70 family)
VAASFSTISPGEASVEQQLAGAYLDHRESIRATVLRMTRDQDVADDILHEAYLRLTRAAQSGPLPTNVPAWLRRVATNLVVDWARRRRLEALTRPDDRHEAGPEAIVVDRELHQALAEALAQLPDDARRALLLYGAGYPSLEIGALIGRTDGATRTLLCRARKQTRDLLVAAGSEPVGAQSRSRSRSRSRSVAIGSRLPAL